MAVTDRTEQSAGATWKPWVLGAICAAVDLGVGVGLALTRFGLILFMSDADDSGPLLLTFGLGLLLGIAQASWAGARTTVLGAVAALVSLVLLGFYALILGPSVLVLCVGVGVGAIIALGLRWSGRSGMLGGIGIIAVATGVVVAALVPAPSVERAPLLEIVAYSDQPAVVIDVAQRVHERDVTGVLGVVGGCWGLIDRPNGAPDAVIVWPLGTGADTNGTITAHRRTWSLGDDAVIPGTVVNRPVDLDAYAPDLPAGCRAHPLVL